MPDVLLVGFVETMSKKNGERVGEVRSSFHTEQVHVEEVRNEPKAWSMTSIPGST